MTFDAAILILIFTLEVMAIVFVEKKIYGTFLSPSVILGVPLLVVVLLASVIGPYLGYITIDNKAIGVIIAGVGVFFLSGIMIKSVIFGHENVVILKNNLVQKEIERVERVDNKASKVSVALCYISMALIAGYLLLNRNVLSLLGSSLFGDAMTQGILGHLHILANSACIVVIATISKKKLHYILPIAIVLGYNILIGVKYNLIILFLGGLMLRVLMGNMRIKFGYLVLTAIAAFAMATIVYLTEFMINGVDITINVVTEVVIHLTDYLFSGVLAMGAYIEHTIPTGNLMMAFQPVITIINFATFNLLDLQYPTLSNAWDGWVSITNNGRQINVGTFFGSLYYYFGLAGMILVTMIIAVAIYLLFFRIMKKSDILNKAIYVIVVCPLALSWFGYYYNLLTFYEIPAFYFVCYVLLKINEKREKVKIASKAGVR